jgi:uncharacterized protein YpmB
MKNQGISLISLIITIIVIIILAAIVIFTGLSTPNSAQFSAFTNDVDTVQAAMLDKFATLKVSHSISGDYRTNEQIYLEIATGKDPKQYARMDVDSVVPGGTSVAVHTAETGYTADATKCQLINNGENNYPAASAEYIGSNSKLGITLPKVRQNNESWYVTADGRIFNSRGYTYNGNTYYNATYYTAGKEVKTDHLVKRAKKICEKMYSTSNNDFTVEEVESES